MAKCDKIDCGNPATVILNMDGQLCSDHALKAILSRSDSAHRSSDKRSLDVAALRPLSRTQDRIT